MRRLFSGTRTVYHNASPPEVIDVTPWSSEDAPRLRRAELDRPLACEDRRASDADLLDRVEDMSDEEVERRLSEMTAQGHG